MAFAMTYMTIGGKLRPPQNPAVRQRTNQERFLDYAGRRFRGSEREEKPVGLLRSE